MKASLRAGLTDGNWVDKLPWVMLGLRCAPKEDLQSSSAELVYGQTLRVPGEFIPTATVPWSAARQRSSLLETAGTFAPVPTSQHSSPAFRVSPGLRSADFVFIRHDAHRGPLRPPYDGPFRVIRHGDKSLVVDVGGRLGGRPETVSVDRIKPAHVDVSRPLELVLPPRRGRPPMARRPPPTPCGDALALVGAPALACGPALLGPCGPYAPGSGGTSSQARGF